MHFFSQARSTYANRLDLLVFLLAFFLGVVVYITSEWLLHLSQFAITSALLVTMILYVLVIFGVPRLLLRPDQAGDNAYYLGLLFTLLSMAVALYNFDTASSTAVTSTGETLGVKSIVANFGIALATTITGIFLRVLLHQMRVDPNEIEQATRVELAEASKRVRAVMENVVTDLGRFQVELQQRSDDLLQSMVTDVGQSVRTTFESLETHSVGMLTSVQAAQSHMLEETQKLINTLGATATEAIGAVERLRSVEAPPLTLARRLAKVTEVLDAVGKGAESLSAGLDGSAIAARQTVQEMSSMANGLNQAALQMQQSARHAGTTIEASVNQVSAALDAVGQRLELDRDLLIKIQNQTVHTAEESLRAQAAATEVLTRLTALTRGLTELIRNAKADAVHGFE